MSKMWYHIGVRYITRIHAKQTKGMINHVCCVFQTLSKNHVLLHGHGIAGDSIVDLAVM